MKTQQVGGTHYQSLAIQPIEYILKNNMGWAEGEIIKYLSRWRLKNGLEDLKKAKSILDTLIVEAIAHEHKAGGRHKPLVEYQLTENELSGID